jgi:hypothetical protein
MSSRIIIAREEEGVAVGEFGDLDFGDGNYSSPTYKSIYRQEWPLMKLDGPPKLYRGPYHKSDKVPSGFYATLRIGFSKMEFFMIWGEMATKEISFAVSD